MSKPRELKRAALYARVSTTNGQDPENQLLALREVAERQGWTIVTEYVDNGISGAKGREQRPEFDRLWKDASRRRFDLVMAWSIDRIGRSTKDVANFMADMEALGVEQVYLQQAIDTSTPTGRAMVQMCSVFAELERGLIQERVKAGLARARSKGKRLGRPRVSKETEGRIHRLRAEGMGYNRIATTVGCGNAVVQRVLAAV